MNYIGLAAENAVKLSVPGWHWVLLLGWFGLLLLIDLVVFHREDHVPTLKQSITQTIIWVGLGIAMGFVFWPIYGGHASAEYFSGFAIEKSLSIDNVFVWSIILSYFNVPGKYQHRVLFWGVFGALLFRALFIFAGVALIERFEITLLLLGGLLLFTGYKVFRSGDNEFDPKRSVMIKWLKKIIPVSHNLHGHALFTHEDGKRVATMLFVALCAIELTDIFFAIDSVPAILAVARDPFIVFASNASAILGLRALYSVFHGMKDKFWLLNQGLGIILVGVGIKMLISPHEILGIPWLDIHTPTIVSLSFILGVLAISIAGSLRIAQPEKKS
ncbi:TerC/Alx family metal homeostasis membrane protein [Patescibacteria group bacterium]|nr:MAG: TerC/Alx family metal homeostasis membrane protein [Patescibacteria group bacterium]